MSTNNIKAEHVVLGAMVVALPLKENMIKSAQKIDRTEA